MVYQEKYQAFSGPDYRYWIVLDGKWYGYLHIAPTPQRLKQLVARIMQGHYSSTTAPKNKVQLIA